MSTPNFKTQKDFELYINDFAIYDENGDLEDNDYYLLEETEEEIEKLNSDLQFFRVTLMDGHYIGTQFYVDDNDRIEQPTDYTAAEWREERIYDDYHYPYAYSVAIRKRKAEINRINRWMSRTGVKLGFEHYYCTGIFSNGEAVYSRATTRAQITAICAGTLKAA